MQHVAVHALLAGLVAAAHTHPLRGQAVAQPARRGPAMPQVALIRTMMRDGAVLAVA